MTEGLLAQRQGWEENAECKDVNPDIFFHKDQEETARDICSKCTVQEECLSFALEHNIQHGVWGGLGEDKRRRFRRRLRERPNQQMSA